MDDKPLRLKGVVGIQNMGNSCYVNTVLQLLRSSPAWSEYCLTNEISPDKKVIAAYKDMLSTMWSAYQPAYVRPLAFMAEIRGAVMNTPYAMFAIPMQHDAHEYLAYLIDQFHEEVKTDAVYEETNEQTMDAMAKRAWNLFLFKKTSPLTDIFYGMMRKTVMCSHCATKTYQWEIYNTLKINCKGETLLDWIKAEVNEVTEIEQYKCDTCKGSHPAKKYSHVWSLPKHLFVVIDRFQWNGAKTMTSCPLLMEMDMREWYAEEAPVTSSIYQLCGMGDHHGAHIHGGHYTSQWKHPLSNDWWLCDDEHMHQLIEPQSTSSAYILSYKQI